MWQSLVSASKTMLFIVYSLPNIGQSDMKTIEESKTLFLPSRHSKDSDIFMGNNLLNGQSKLIHGLYSLTWFGFILSMSALCDHCNGNASMTTWIWTLDPTSGLH